MCESISIGLIVDEFSKAVDKNKLLWVLSGHTNESYLSLCSFRSHMEVISEEVNSIVSKVRSAGVLQAKTEQLSFPR